MAKKKLPQHRIPPEVAPEVKQTYLEALRSHGLVSRACEAANVTYATVKGWRSDPEFAEAERFAGLFRDDNVREALDDLVAQRNPAAVIHASKRLPEHQVAKKAEISVTGQVTHDHILAQLEPQEVDKLIEDAAQLIELEKGRDYE